MLDPIRSSFLLSALALTLGACDPGSKSQPDTPLDDIDAPLWVKADGGCPAPGSGAAEGLLALVNDTATTADLLDRPLSRGGVGLDRRAAEGILDGRPFDSLEELDAVPYVGPASCRALVNRACNEDGRCDEPLRVVTWNVEHFPLTASAVTAVPQVILDLDLDAVAVQEIEDDAAFAEVLDALPGYSGFLADPGPFTRVGLIVRDSALDVVDVHSEFVDDGWAFPRPPLVVETKIRGALDDASLTFVVLHLKARVDPTSQGRREDAIEKLRNYIDDRREGGPQPMVVLGDWNDSLTDPPSWNVFGTLLDDDADSTFLTMDAAEDGVATIIPYSSTIDHVMVTDEVFDVVTREQTEVLLLDATWADYEDTVSDHRPVMTTFQVARSYP